MWPLVGVGGLLQAVSAGIAGGKMAPTGVARAGATRTAGWPPLLAGRRRRQWVAFRSPRDCSTLYSAALPGGLAVRRRLVQALKALL